MEAVTSQARLTTLDNPFNPITQPDAWLNYDLNMGHSTYALIDRVAGFNESMDEDQKDQAENAAIESIIRYDPSNLYYLATKDTDCEKISRDYLASASAT